MKQKGIYRIIALTDIKNIKSQKFFEKNGFKKAHIRYVKEI
jgi:RimJ/RimL family protein N-acetyltransferase